MASTTHSASPAVIETEGKTLKSFVGSTYTWDNLDNPNRPSNGFRGQLVGEFAGLGGDVYFGAIEAHAWYFIPIYEEQVVLKLEGNAGYIHGFNGKTVPLQDRFYKGGDSFRGFANSGVGVFQGTNNGDTDAIGAQHLCDRYGRDGLPARPAAGVGHRRRSLLGLRYGVWL